MRGICETMRQNEIDELKRKRVEVLKQYKNHEIQSVTAIRELNKIDAELNKARRKK